VVLVVQVVQAVEAATTPPQVVTHSIYQFKDLTG
jgi:hypothetical protein